MLHTIDNETQTLSDMTFDSLKRRGAADGRAGRPAQSDAPAYTGAYAKGNLFRMAAAREIVLAFTFVQAAKCPACSTLYFGFTHCACTGQPVACTPGMMAAFGQDEDDEDPLVFMSNTRARELCAEGIHVITDDGDCLTSQLMIQ